MILTFVFLNHNAVTFAVKIKKTCVNMNKVRSVTLYVVFVFTVHLPLFRPIHHDITTSYVHINTLFRYVYSNRYSVAIKEHKCDYYCTIYFKIAVVNIVLCIAVPYCCSLFYIYHKFIFSIEIITLFQYSLTFHFSDEQTQR